MADVDTLRPACQACGCTVVDSQAHARWHATLALASPAVHVDVTTVDPSNDQPIEAPEDPALDGRRANANTLRDRAAAALAANVAWLASAGLSTARATDQAFLALEPPTAAQNAAQVRALTTQVLDLLDRAEALTRQASTLIRLTVDELESTET